MTLTNQLIHDLNRHHRRATATAFALKPFGVIRTVCFAAAWMFASYSLNLAGIFDPQVNISPLQLWLKPLAIAFLVPVAASVIYLPILWLIGYAKASKPLFDPSYVGTTVTKTVHEKATKLEKDRYNNYHRIYIDRHRYIKIPLALVCGLLVMISCMNAVPEEAANLFGAAMGTGAWYVTVAGFSLGFALFLYPLIALFYYFTDSVALFPYTRYGAVSKVGSLIKPIVEDWEQQEKEREEAEKARKQAEEEAAAQAAAAEKARKEKEKREQNVAKAEPLYAQAIAADPVDEQLMEKAAKLGHPKASIYVGWNLILDQERNPYTNAERRKIQKKALDYLSIFTSEEDAEGVFTHLFAKALYEESLSQDEWDVMLQRARRIKKSGKLPEKYATACDNLIEKLVYEVDNAAPVYGGGGGLVLGADDYARIAAAAERAVSGGYIAPSYGDSGAYGYPAELGADYNPVSGDGI